MYGLPRRAVGRAMSGGVDDYADEMSGGRRKKATRKPSARNVLVKKVMMERGCSLPEASRIVKQEGLY
jgi:hypothetical protein